jgi:hypothetical protein
MTITGFKHSAVTALYRNETKTYTHEHALHAIVENLRILPLDQLDLLGRFCCTRRSRDVSTWLTKVIVRDPTEEHDHN